MKKANGTSIPTVAITRPIGPNVVSLLAQRDPFAAGGRRSALGVGGMNRVGASVSEVGGSAAGEAAAKKSRPSPGISVMCRKSTSSEGHLSRLFEGLDDPRACVLDQRRVRWVGRAGLHPGGSPTQLLVEASCAMVLVEDSKPKRGEVFGEGGNERVV